MMIIQFSKPGASGKTTLTCFRSDGTVTWQPTSQYFVYHDLIHFAVETTLGYREAFFGLVSAGKGLNDFGTRNGVRDTYTDEETWAEAIVGMLQWPSAGGGGDLTAAEFLDQLSTSFEGKSCGAPEISVEQLGEIRAQMLELHERWRGVEEGGLMQIEFSDRY